MTLIIKEGWLHRKSSFLRRWKRSWYVLTSDGYFREYESPDSIYAHNSIKLPRDVYRIKARSKYSHELFGMEHILKFDIWENYLKFYAQSEDDMLSWYTVLQQTREMNKKTCTLM